MRTYYSEIKLIEKVPSFPAIYYSKNYFLTTEESLHNILNIIFHKKSGVSYESISTSYLPFIIALQARSIFS